ncbi:MAG: hypothetical protein ACE5I5_06555 [Candidatus Heimdallarchaeota archaeon]
MLPIKKVSPTEGFQDYSYPPVIVTDPQILGHVGSRQEASEIRKQMLFLEEYKRRAKMERET